MGDYRLKLNNLSEQEYLPMLRNLINTMPCGVGIFIFSPKMGCEFYSDNFAKMAGLTRQEMDEKLEEGTVLSSIIAPMDYPMVMEYFAEKMAKGEDLNLDYRYLYSDGSLRWLRLSAKKLREKDGYPVYYCVFTQPPDEATLYYSIVESSSIGVLIAERQSRKLIYTNGTARSIYGVPDVREISAPMKQYLAGIGKTLLLSDAQVAALQEDKFTVFHLERNGSFFAASAKAISWNGVDSYVIYLSDETEEVKRKKELEDLVNNVPGGLGIFDVHKEEVKLLYLNDAFFNIMQIKPQDRKAYLSGDLEDNVHPEDRAVVVESCRRLMAGAEKDAALFRLKNGQGDWIWVNFEVSVSERSTDCLRAYVAFMNCDSFVKTQKAMEEAQKKEEVLLASIPGGVAVYRLKKDGRAVTEFVSEGLAKMCGYDNKEELLAYFKENAMVNVVEEDIPIIIEAAKKSIATHQPISVVYRIHVKGKADILQRLDASLIEDVSAEDELGTWYAVHTMVSDDFKQAMAEQARYRTIMGNLDIAFLEVEPGKSYYASSKYYDYALSEESFDAVATNTANPRMTHPEDFPLLKAFFDDVKNKKTKSSAILRLKMKDGSYKWTEIISFCYYDQRGNLARVVGILRDVDKERIEQNERLREALISAQQANKAKTVFLSRMSHDMRTPLNGVLGLTAFMKESVKDEKVLEDLEDLEISGKYLLNLINDTLDVSRIESGRVDMHPTVCEISQLVKGVLKLANPNIKHARINLQANIPFANDEYIYVDKNRFEQAIMNVLGNAIKFTPPGGTITIDLKNIAKDRESLTTKIIISDTGVGISQEFLPHIFEPFSQEDNSLTANHKGTGLGMAITKQLIELMGGSISVDSQVGKGTAFTITMKFSLATLEEIAEAKKYRLRKLQDCDFTGKRVLLCEDHPLNAKIATRLMAGKGMEVDVATNGQKGLELFSASQPGYYDAILMDIRMPVMDGITACRHIRGLEREDAGTIPIIAMTANAFDDDVEQTHAAGMNDHLSKPVDREAFYQCLAREMELI